MRPTQPMKFTEGNYMHSNIEALWEALSEQNALIQALQYELQELREQLTHLRN